MAVGVHLRCSIATVKAAAFPRVVRQRFSPSWLQTTTSAILCCMRCLARESRNLSYAMETWHVHDGGKGSRENKMGMLSVAINKRGIEKKRKT